MTTSAGAFGLGAAAGSEAPRRRDIRTWETWVTLSLVLLAFLAVTASIEQADWTPEMPSLFVASLVGLAMGFALAHVPLPGVVLHPVALLGGAALTVTQSLLAIELPLGAPDAGMRARWDELVLRLQEWASALASGDISTDPIPFILLVVLLSWGMAYLAGWSVFRWRNAWFAVVPGGFALLTNISYLPGQPSFAFIVFVFAAMLLVTRMHALRAEDRWQDEQAARPPFLSLEVLHFATWVGLALIIAAWLIPTANNWGPVTDAWQRALAPLTDRIDRLGRVFVGIDSKRLSLVHSFEDVLPLQGQVQLSQKPILKVQAPEDVTYLRAAVYDEYTGRSWRLSKSSGLPLLGTSVDAATFGTPSTRAQFRRPARIDIEVIESDVVRRRLLTPGEVLATDIDTTLLVGGDPADIVGVAPVGRDAPSTYSAVGTVSAATARTLLDSPTVYPQWVVDRYLQLPSTLPPEVRALAAEVTAGAPTPYQSARRIEQYLRQEYPYDLAVPDPSPRADAVGVFLLQTRRGYFDQHASAMVVMLRSVGVPARVAVGFALDSRDFDQTTKSYTLSDRNAWTWPEVYFAGLGWIEFNPTPARPPIVRPLDDSEFGTDETLLDPSLDPTEGFLLDEAEVGVVGPSGFAPIDPDDGALSPVIGVIAQVLSALVVVSALVLVALLAFRFGWAVRFRGLSPPLARWSKLEFLARLAGLGALPTATAIESATALRAAADLPPGVIDLARDFSRARYGGGNEGAPESTRAPAIEEARAASYVQARNRLVRLALRRALPLGRRGGVPAVSMSPRASSRG